jgi:hypothetical protein
VSLVDIADELYGLPLDEFTAARNARAKTDKQVKSLPKPSAAAWAINQFVRSSPAKLEQVFALGEKLREAQGELDASTMRSLGQQRRSLITALAKEISSTASARTEIEQTLQAAMADEDAAAAVASGRLVRALSTDGLEAADLEGAVAVPVAGTRRPKPKKKAPSAAARTKAQAAVDAAQADREKAESTVAELDEKVAGAAAAQESAGAELERLEAKLAAARAKVEHASGDASRLARARSTAQERIEKAELAEQRAVERLESLD